MNRTINISPGYTRTYRPAPDVLSSFSRVVTVVEYNLIDSGFFGLHESLVNMVNTDEAERIINYIGNKAGIDDISLLIDELQTETELDLSPNTVLFIMISPAIHIADQLNIDEDIALWLYDKLHMHFITDDIIGWMKEMLLEAESYKANIHLI